MVYRKKKSDFLFNIGIIIIVAVLLIVPQIVMQSMVIGSDSIFHFNRFFDTASQIQHGNFQYFIHMYGFQQSGRIVNALYGPLMAYFQGFLVLISPSWFVYQVLSNWILYLIAGLSMYCFLKVSSIRKDVSLFVSLFFMTTFSIQYWITRQGFTSWGAALLPLCLLPIIYMEKHNTFKVFQVGFFMALMTQVHMFTALLLAVIYFAYYLVLFSNKDTDKWGLVFSLICSIFIYLLLTLNIWYSILTIYMGNTIIPPFVNRNIHLNTITANSYYWLLNPVFLLLFIGLKLYHDVKHWKTYNQFEKVSSLLILAFLLFTTNVVPWKFLSDNDLLGVRSIQFPFRFFVPFTVLLLISVAKVLDSTTLFFENKKWFKLILVFSVVQGIGLSAFSSLQWQSSDPIPSSKHQFLYTDQSEVLKASFFSQDKSLSLEYVQKATPDYLPVYHDDDSNKYVQYKNYIIDENRHYEKKVENNSLVLTWEGESASNRNLPVVIYHNTEVKHNNETLTADNMDLTSIGTLVVSDEIGKNVLEISYKNSKFFLITLLITLFTWIVSILLIGYKVINRFK